MISKKVDVYLLPSSNWINVYIVTFWDVMIFNVRSFFFNAKNIFRCPLAIFKSELPWFSLNSMVTWVVIFLLNITVVNTSWIVFWFVVLLSSSFSGIFAIRISFFSDFTSSLLLLFRLYWWWIYLYKLGSLLMIIVFGGIVDDSKDGVLFFHAVGRYRLDQVWAWRT